MSELRVAEELRHIREKVDQHDQLMVRMVELQERQIAQNDRMSEYMERTDKRLDRMETQQTIHEKDTRASVSRAHERIDENKATILRWSGGFAALIGVVGIATAIWNKLPSGGG